MLTCPQKKRKKGHSSNTSVLWQKGLLAGVTSKGGSTDGSAGLTLTNSGMLQHQALKHEALEHGQAVPALKGATMNNCCFSVLLERLRYVSAGMAEGDGDVKCSVLSAQQSGNAESGCTVLSMFWDRNSQRKLNFEALQAYLINFFFPVIFLFLPKPRGSSFLAFHHCNCCTARQVHPSARRRVPSPQSHSLVVSDPRQ